MNFNLTENQKRILTAAATSIMMLLALFLGYNVEKAPAVVTPEPEFGAAAISSGIKCGASPDPCVIANWGRDLLVYSDEQSTSKFSVDGATGNTSIGGTLGVTGLVTINGVKCIKGSQTVIGSATVIPATLTAAGISTPSWVGHSMAGDPGNTHYLASNANAAGVVTLKTWNNMLSGTVTPQAATTAVAINYEVCGTN